MSIVMKIDRQFQDLHARDLDGVMQQEIERDICLLYHQLSKYSYIMEDLDYGTVFALPYWQFLQVKDLPTDDQEFLRDGCLVMILAMAWECVDGGGHYLREYLPACRAALDTLDIRDERTAKLARTVRLALDMVEHPSVELEELAELSSWVHREYVRGYFRRVVHNFDHNPYLRGAIV